VSAAQHKTFRLGQRKAAATPSPEQLAAINAYTLRDFTADELHVRTFVLCHNAVDRDGECFDEALLADFAKSLPGKGVFVKHPTGWDGDTGPGEGLVFATRVETMSLEGAQELMRGQALALPPDRSQLTVLLADAFFPKTADNAALLTKLDAGVACFVSVGFTAEGGRKQITDAAGHEYEIRRWHAPGEAHEMSLVWLGAQPGARAVKSANRTNEATDMELKDQLTAEQAKTAALTTERDAAKAAASKLDALKAALGGDAALADNPAQVAGLVLAGKAYRTTLVDAVVKSERLAGVLGDDPEAVEAARKDYDALPLATLKRLAASAQATGDLATPGIQGGDPNAAKPTGAATKGAFDSPVFQN
jgi:hypothetical protein